MVNRTQARPFAAKAGGEVLIRSYGMTIFSKWVGALAATALLAGAAAAADSVSGGTIKGVDSAKKEFVLTDTAGKDWTIKFGDAVINRGGKESQSDLKTGDAVNVTYEKGVLSWTAHYILVQEGDFKTCELVNGTLKGYDADKKELTLTDGNKKDWSFSMGAAKVRLNKEDGKIEDVKIGDSTLAIVDMKGDKGPVLKSLMVSRK
jgi:hypothetical protein